MNQTQVSNPYQPPRDSLQDQPSDDLESIGDENDPSVDQPGFLFYVAASVVVWGIILAVMVIIVLVVGWLAMDV